MRSKRKRKPYHHNGRRRPRRKWVKDRPKWNGEQIKRVFNARTSERKKAS